MKNMIVSGMGLGLSILQGLMRRAEARGVTPEMIHWLSTQKSEANAALDIMADKMAEVLIAAQNRNGKVFCIKRGGKHTTEQVVGATTHSLVNENINSKNFPLTERPEEERERVVFQVLEYDHNPSSEEILKEFKLRGLERPIYEDAFKFDKAHPDEKGVFVFFHEPRLDPGRVPVVLVVVRGGAFRGLGLGWFGGTWGRSSWFVGVRPRK